MRFLARFSMAWCAVEMKKSLKVFVTKGEIMSIKKYPIETGDTTDVIGAGDTAFVSKVINA